MALRNFKEKTIFTLAYGLLEAFAALIFKDNKI